MDLQAELRSECDALVQADLDIRNGEARLRKQQAVVERLRARNCDTREAERFLTLLHNTLVAWQQHRALMLQRIAYLEAKCAAVPTVEPG